MYSVLSVSISSGLMPSLRKRNYILLWSGARMYYVSNFISGLIPHYLVPLQNLGFMPLGFQSLFCRYLSEYSVAVKSLIFHACQCNLDLYLIVEDYSTAWKNHPFDTKLSIAIQFLIQFLSILYQRFVTTGIFLV